MIKLRHIKELCRYVLAAGIISSAAATQLSGAPPGTELQPLVPNYLASTQSYWAERKSIMVSQRARRFCAAVTLNAAEQKADDYLYALRNRETAPYIKNGQFPPARMFCEAKSEIEQLQSFRVLRQMPKGGALHVHWPAIGPVSWIISNATYRPDCYVRWVEHTNDPMHGQLIFRSAQQVATNFPAGYVSAQSLRAQLRAKGRSLDKELEELLTLHPGRESTPAVWNEFDNLFERVWPFATFQPLFADYLIAGIQSFLDDGVQYMEIRTPVVPLTDLNGHQWDDTNFLQAFKEVRERVRAQRPDFNLKLIIAGTRGELMQNLSALLADTTRYQKMFPDLVVGCDLVGDEDTGHTTQHFVPILSAYAYTNRTCHFFFHDGESDWPHDNNLIDAVLLGSRRIGHGFNLFHWPEVEQMVRERDIVLEVCPISNQALRLSRDIRTHPAAGYLKRGVQCVLSSDDPGLLGNYGLSYDFWEAYMAWALDVPALKQLAHNSLHHSAMTPDERNQAEALWQEKWNAWIAWINSQH